MHRETIYSKWEDVKLEIQAEDPLWIFRVGRLDPPTLSKKQWGDEGYGS